MGGRGGRGGRERRALHRVRAARGKDHSCADPNGAHRSGLHGGDERAVGEGHRDRAVEHGGALGMLLGQIVRVALEALRANKLRSLLTMLGIIIGVGAVITMIALGSGAQKAVQDRIQALGPTLLSIYPGQSFMRGVASGNRVSLTMDDDTALANNARYLSAVVPELSSNIQGQKADQNINVTVMGTTPNYTTVHNYTVTAGRMFTAGDDAARRRVAVLGSAVPQMLNSNRDAMIGQDVLIRSISFEIIGVLSEKGSQGSFFNPDEQILIPLQTARYRVMGTDRLRDITVQARDLGAQGAWRHALQHHVPVPRRGPGVVPRGRPDRRGARLARRGLDLPAGALEHAHLSPRHPARVRVQRGGGPVLRHLARAPRCRPRSDRRAEIRIVGADNKGRGE